MLNEPAKMRISGATRSGDGQLKTALSGFGMDEKSHETFHDIADELSFALELAPEILTAG